MQELAIKASSSGYSVPLDYFPAREARAHILLLPALGVQAKLYHALAEKLAESGISTLVMEQRGHGRSAWRASKSCNYGFKEWLEEDIPAAVKWLEQQDPKTPLYLAGHSLGGHVSLMARTQLPQVKGVILLTTATPWHQCYEGGARWQLRTLIAVVPMLTSILGYYPGHRVGFGGREARRLMADWLVMARHNRYHANGTGKAYERLVQADDCPVLSIYCDEDKFAPLAGVKGVTQRLENHSVQLEEITSAQLGTEANHVAWARKPELAVELIRNWIEV